MCKERKYEKYQIEVVYLNGDKETLKLAGINTNSYTKMIEVYKNVKEKYSDEAKEIKFLGVTKDDQLEILFTKEFKNKINTDLDKDFIDIAHEVAEKFNLLSKKLTHDEKMMSAMDKKIDVILHRLRLFKGNNEEKIELFNLLQELEIKRTYYKNQHLLEKEFLDKYKNVDMNFIHIRNIFKSVKHKENKLKELTFEVAKEKNVYEEKIVKNKKKDVEAMKKVYNNVYYNEGNNICYGYNNAKQEAI